MPCISIPAVYKQTGTISVPVATEATITFNDLHTNADDIFGLSAGGIPRIKKGGLFIVVGQIQTVEYGTYNHGISYSTTGAYLLNQFMGAGGLHTKIADLEGGEVYQGHIYIFSNAEGGTSPADDASLNLKYSHSNSAAIGVSAEMLVVKMGNDLGASVA